MTNQTTDETVTRSRRERDAISRRYRPRLDEHEPLEHPWDAYVEVWNVLRPAWWPILVTVVMMTLILAVGQIQDVLAAMPLSSGGQSDATGISGRYWTTLLSCAAFSLFAWAFGRGLLAVRFPYTPCPMDPPDWHVSLRLLVARLLGIAMPAAMAAAYFGLNMFAEAWVYVGLCAILLLIYAYVKPFLKDWIYTPEELEAERQEALIEADVALDDAEDALEDAAASEDTTRQRYLLGRVADLARDAGERVKIAGETFADVSLYDRAMPSRFPRQMNILLYTILALHLVIAVLVMVSKVQLPQAMGAAAILYLSAGGWMALGVFLFSYWPRFSRLPSGLLLLAVWLGLASMFNHNHHVRLIDAPQLSGPVPTLSDYTHKWLSSRQAFLPRTQDDPDFPLFVIAAEGGGARAAYWTGRSLDQIAQIESAFGLSGTDHIFMVSSVSGGSVGTAAWAAGLTSISDPVRRSEELDIFLREDFLSPVTAGTMYVDLPSDLLPFPVRQFDRANWLERSFEVAWDRLSWKSHNPFENDYRALWSGEKPLGDIGSVPLLSYNTTAVRTGGVWQVSPVRLNEIYEPSCDSGDFEDLLRGLDKGLPLSTAVHLSARFTGISPAGEIALEGYPGCAELDHERFVDGAYFENSGADTATRVISRLRYEIETYCEPLDGAPALCNPDGINIVPIAIRTEVPPPGPAPDFMHETLSVVSTVANTRIARGQDSLRRMGEASGGPIFTIELPASWKKSEEGQGCQILRQNELSKEEPDYRSVPLGWTLSKEAADHMCRQSLMSDGLLYLSLILNAP
jgi:hypothetical protein